MPCSRKGAVFHSLLGKQDWGRGWSFNDESIIIKEASGSEGLQKMKQRFGPQESFSKETRPSSRSLAPLKCTLIHRGDQRPLVGVCRARSKEPVPRAATSPKGNSLAPGATRLKATCLPSSQSTVIEGTVSSDVGMRCSDDLPCGQVGGKPAAVSTARFLCSSRSQWHPCSRTSTILSWEPSENLGLRHDIGSISKIQLFRLLGWMLAALRSIWRASPRELAVIIFL